MMLLIIVVLFLHGFIPVVAIIDSHLTLSKTMLTFEAKNALNQF